jgi:hypothetical protein
MITNRALPRIRNLLDEVPEKYKSDVEAALNELEKGGLPEHLNPELIKFNKFKIKVADGDVEIIFERDFATGDVRIVDIKTRINIRGIFEKIRRAIDITPRP